MGGHVIHTKTLSDGSIIPYRIWQYTLEWSWHKEYANIPLLVNRSVTELSAREFWQLFEQATKEDQEKYRTR